MSSRGLHTLLIGLYVGALAACGTSAARGPTLSPTAAVSPSAANTSTTVTSEDPLGSRPQAAQPAAFTPPTPVLYTRPNGMVVWLLERHTLPIVSMQVVVPAGSADDPEGKGGLAYATANMLDEGAARRGALEIARDVDRLGATLATGATSDYGWARLTVLKKNLGDAATIFGDVVAKPSFPAADWRRVHDLWLNALRARQSEPTDVADVVVTRKLYDAHHPYAHPTEGTLRSAARVSVEDVKKFYGQRWRPDRATCVVVGDITRAELDEVLDRALIAWTAPKSAPPSDALPRGTVGATGRRRRVLIVDRPDAPQSVITVALPGVSALAEESSPLDRINAALGGSFTSRLNQSLREEKGWSYGAGSTFTFTRLPSAFMALAAVQTAHTADALRMMLDEVDALANNGLLDDEVEKTKQLARAALVDDFETVEGTTRRLGRSAGVGRGPDAEAAASRHAERADKVALNTLARRLDTASALIVVVGPRAQIEGQLSSAGFTDLEVTGPEGD